MMSKPEEVDDRDGLVRDDYPEVDLGFFIGDGVDEDEFDNTQYDLWYEEDNLDDGELDDYGDEIEEGFKQPMHTSGSVIRGRA